MKALRFERYGPPSVLSLEDVAVPAPNSGEVLVEVCAAAINPSDVKGVAGAFKASIPRTPGRDYAGVVVAGSDEWKGKEVWGSGPGFGVVRDGTHAQFVLVPIDGLSVKPSKLSMQEASAVGVPYLAAWSALVDAAQLQAYETILITGATGAVGSAATQLAHWRGAKVIGADIADRESEADVCINTKGKDLPSEVRSATNGAGADVVLDCVGGPMFEPSLKSLRRGGRQVAITSVGNRRVEFDLIDFFQGQKRLIGVDTGKLTGHEIAQIMDYLRDGFDRDRLKPSLTESWPLGKAIDAYTAVETHPGMAKRVLLPQQN